MITKEISYIDIYMLYIYFQIVHQYPLAIYWILIDYLEIYLYIHWIYFFTFY